MPNQSQPSPTTPKTVLRSVFVSHPESVGESYFEHLRAALGFSTALAIAAAAAFLHALVPCMCQSTARTKIETLHNQLQGRVPAKNHIED